MIGPIDYADAPFAIIVHKDFAGCDLERFLERHSGLFHDAWRAWIGGRFEYLTLVCISPASLRSQKPAVYYIEGARELLQVIEQSHADCAPPIEWKCCVVRESPSHLLLARVLPADRVTFMRLDHVFTPKPRYIIEREAEEAKRMRKVKARRNKKLREAKAKVAKKKAAKRLKPAHPYIRGV